MELVQENLTGHLADVSKCTCTNGYDMISNNCYEYPINAYSNVHVGALLLCYHTEPFQCIACPVSTYNVRTTLESI
eukprot:767880-Hanusia_phi.AAC.1